MTAYSNSGMFVSVVITLSDAHHIVSEPDSQPSLVPRPHPLVWYRDYVWSSKADKIMNPVLWASKKFVGKLLMGKFPFHSEL